MRRCCSKGLGVVMEGKRPQRSGKGSPTIITGRRLSRIDNADGACYGSSGPWYDLCGLAEAADSWKGESSRQLGLFSGGFRFLKRAHKVSRSWWPRIRGDCIDRYFGKI